MIERQHAEIRKGIAGNLGMYGMGIPAGLLVDRRGPKYGIAMGTIALAFGYFPLRNGMQASKARNESTRSFRYSNAL